MDKVRDKCQEVGLADALNRLDSVDLDCTMGKVRGKYQGEGLVGASSRLDSVG